MPENVNFKREYQGGDALLEITRTFYHMRDDLAQMGHFINSKELTDPSGIEGKEEGCATYMLPQYLPIATIHVEATKWLEKNTGHVSLGIRHFFKKNKKFPEVTEIASKYGLEPY